MNLHFPKADSRQYFYTWILMIVVGWVLWFFALDHIIKTGGFLFAAILGSIIGLISGLPPAKAFKVCFYGFCVVALLLLFRFPTVALSQIFVGTLGGLFAMASSILRCIAFHKNIEVPVKSWQWVLLIGGATLLADFIVILGMIQELFVYHHLDFLYQYLLPVLLGLFASGLFVGTFSHLEKADLMKSLKRLLAGIHGLFIIFVLFVFIMDKKIEWNLVLFLPFIAFFSVLVLEGTKIGFRFRNSEIVKHSNDDSSNSE
jgi:hypothetical protein